MRHDPIKYILHTLWAMLAVIVLIFLALVTHAKAFTEGAEYTAPVNACTSLEDARLYFSKKEEEPPTCGAYRIARFTYIKEVESFSVEGGKITLHLVQIMSAPGNPVEYVASFTKLQEM